MLRYVVHPGKVRSKTDDDVHHVGAARLIALYRVDPREAEVFREHAAYPKDVIHLYPDPGGRYEIPGARSTTRSLVRSEWEPSYAPWRHGGWYVMNARYPSGAVGCVSRNYTDKKWRIVCDPRDGSWPGGPNDHTYPSRDAAARAERALIEEEKQRASAVSGEG